VVFQAGQWVRHETVQFQPFKPLRAPARWLNRRRSLTTIARAWREFLPGDPSFGDPLSTTGSDPTQVIARRVYALNETRWGLASEVGLAALQVADWLGEDVGPGTREDEVAILFTDLVGFSSWALATGDRASLELLRRVDAAVTSAVESAGGQVVKRLGDGTMAVFPDPSDAVEAARAALAASAEIKSQGYDAKLRAGLHFGKPRAIGSDFIGIDVNIAARLCEAAEAKEVLVSDAVRERLDLDRAHLGPRNLAELDGVPDGLRTYALVVGAA
jgi:adenylate cyclase